MRILKIIPQAFYTTRGTPLSAYHRAKELVSRGHQVDILTYSVGSAPPELPVRVFRSKGPHFSRSIEAGPSRLKIWFDFLLFVNLLWRLTRDRYDLLYAHEEGAFLARLAATIFRVPYVYDMHSSLPLQITDWKFSESRFVVRLFRWVERVSVRGARAVVAISPAVARVATEVSPTSEVITIVNHFEIGPAPDPQEAATIRTRYGIAPDRKVVLYTGSFVALQALDLLIEAVPQVVAGVPNAVFLLVGGTEAEIQPLKEQAQRLGVGDRVVFETTRPQREMPTYMAASDVLVSPRIQGINPPGKLLSYLASGLPVVATDVLVHNQLLDRECAVLTPPDAAGIAHGLVRALTDKELADSVARAAKVFLKQYGSKEARDAAYDRLFNAVSAPERPTRDGLRVLKTSYEFPPLGGGGAKVASNIAARLSARGYAVDVVTMGFHGLPSRESIRGVSVRRVPGVRMRVSTCSMFEMIPYVMLAPFRIVRQTRLAHYTINHTHFIFPDGVVAYIAKRFTGLPYVITAHGSDVPGYNPNRFRLAHRLLLPVWRKITDDASLILCPSATIEGLIKASNPRARTLIVPNAIEGDRFKPQEKRADRLLVVTRMFERKGVQYVLKGLAACKQRFDVHIVGDGPYLQTLKDLAKELKVPVTFYGHLANDSPQLKDLYETSSIFVFTSESENFPIVLLEAMTAGTAIITTKGTGCEEVVRDAGILVPVRDGAAIAAALDELACNPERVATLARAARKRVIDCFGWDGVIDQHVRIYTQLALSDPRASSADPHPT